MVSGRYLGDAHASAVSPQGNQLPALRRRNQQMEEFVPTSSDPFALIESQGIYRMEGGNWKLPSAFGSNPTTSTTASRFSSP